MKLKLLSFILLITVASTFAQQFQLSDDAKISVLTIGPGESLNDAFGHNGFRIKDNKLGIDVVYGYGEYDFDAPNFYLKFAQGKLNYLISRHQFSDIFYHYSQNNRTIKEQILNLTIQEKQELFNVLENNYKPENRRYLYDFFYDNCATKIRDVTINTANRKIEFQPPERFELKTFRSLIHDHVGLNTWGSFGIDIALGSVIDRKASLREHMFLPHYIHTMFKDATINGTERLVKNASTLFERKEKRTTLNFLFSPLMVMGLLALAILYLTYKDYKNHRRTKWLDLVIFSVTGLIGGLVLFLWFATDHSATAHNYNLLWAFPLNILVIVQLTKPKIKHWFKSYLKFLIIMLCLMTLHWLIGVQVFAIGLIPLLIALLMRYIYLLKWCNDIRGKASMQ
ncbi:lipoprotein N-acyltransferase Lnb domain-containing protein [Winogradskyella bathintestinalis]|uniref:DUF4105 domain-containing protein n=1 Tax=Winogradskyella bathintestinalis TaxID=3035208 RepID=A0ABT7ZTW3_9FLAO|nr:DUF4105 domain-containing protein [Winogradskyella bathintestinalis]MDN3492404.1 DUF4105 domain-containing protein [Winogradskyella bathintestinalis]